MNLLSLKPAWSTQRVLNQPGLRGYITGLCFKDRNKAPSVWWHLGGAMKLRSFLATQGVDYMKHSFKTKNILHMEFYGTAYTFNPLIRKIKQNAKTNYRS